MIKCEQCQTENIETANYCNSCGQPLTKQTTELTKQTVELEIKETVPFYQNKRYIKALEIAAVLLIALLVGGYFMTRPTPLELATEAYNVHDLERFNTIKDKLSDKQVQLFNEQLVLEANDVYELYQTDAIFHQDAIRRLEVIKPYEIDSQEVSLIMSQVQVLNTSREAYKAGKNWLEAKEWAHAREAFAKVSPDDPNYAETQRYLEAITRWELQEVADRANQFLDAQQYNEAIAEIEKGLVIDPDNEILLNLMAAIETAMTAPPVEESEDEVPPKGFGDIISDGLSALGDSLNSLFDGLFSGN